jgi:hypothetical protein
MLRGPTASGLIARQTKRRRALSAPLVSALAFSASLVAAPLASASDIGSTPRTPVASTAGDAAATGNPSSPLPADPRAKDLSLDLGIRLGLGLPFGNVDGYYGDTLQATVSWLVPVTLEAGVRFRQNWRLGSYLMVAPGDGLGLGCCSALDTQLGLSVHYHVLPGKPVDPWFGVGGGYEILSVFQNGGSASISGWTWGVADAGLDLADASAKHATVGPFVTASLGQFDPLPPLPGAPKPSATLHGWVTFGFRVAFDIGL